MTSFLKLREAHSPTMQLRALLMVVAAVDLPRELNKCIELVGHVGMTKSFDCWVACGGPKR